MKLSTALVDRTETQFGAQALPDNHPAMQQLHSTFGDHTFFLDGDGLHVVEPAGTHTGQVAKIASWADAGRTTLSPHSPEPIDVVIELDTGGSDDEPALG